MVPRWLGVVASLVPLALVPLAAGADARVSAKVTITGSGTSYRGTLVNDGDTPILCFGLLLTGVQPTSATGPPGVLTRVGTFQGMGLVHMQGTAATPVVRPGETVTFDFNTDRAIAPNAGGEIRYSDTCQPGSDQIGRATGPPPPAPPPPPPPKPKPCACKNLKARVVPNRIEVTRNTSTAYDLELLFSWTMTCTKGAGRCEGTLTLVPSGRGKRLGVRVGAPADGKVVCKAGCGKTKSAFAEFRVSAGPKFAAGKRGRLEKLLRLELKRKCKSTRTDQVFFIAFNKSGGIDTRLSDLNANGIDDGKER